MMTPLDLALKYMEIFFTGSDFEEFNHILTQDFQFQGPFYQFDSALSYINALKYDPPKACEYQIIKSYENDSSACLVFQFSKPGILVKMAQTFEIRDGKISQTLLIFDTKEFIKHND
jgi:hypothetical protein